MVAIIANAIRFMSTLIKKLCHHVNNCNIPCCYSDWLEHTECSLGWEGSI